MPEGDSIYRAAQVLNRALAGKPVVRFESVLPRLTRVHEDAPVTGRTIENVESIGKHLLVHLSGDLVLRTHMRMNGSWHVYRSGERWRRARRDMRIVLATVDFEAVGFNIPDAEFIATAELARHPVLARVGPDVLGTAFDRADAVRNLRAQPQAEIGDALLNQRLLAGLGNVYKSEALFLARVNPFVTVERLDDAALTGIVEIGEKLLQINVRPGIRPMTTYSGLRREHRRERLWVYGRADRPCRRCGTLVRIRKQGTHARVTYWCPTCQMA